MPASVQSRDLITAFVGELLQSAKLTALPDAYKETYRRQLEGQVMERLGFVAMSALPQGDLARAEELSEKKDYEALQQLFQKNIPNFPTLVAETLKTFRHEFLESADATRTAVHEGA